MLPACCIEVSFQQSQILQTSRLYVAFRSAQELRIHILMEWVSMAEQMHPSQILPSAMQVVRYNNVKHITAGVIEQRGSVL